MCIFVVEEFGIGGGRACSLLTFSDIHRYLLSFSVVCAPQSSRFWVIIAEHFESLKSMAKMVNLNLKNCLKVLLGTWCWNVALVFLTKLLPGIAVGRYSCGMSCCYSFMFTCRLHHEIPKIWLETLKNFYTTVFCFPLEFCTLLLGFKKLYPVFYWLYLS